MRLSSGMRVGVIMGGVSSERLVSLASGRAICDALVQRGYDAFEVVLDTASLPASLASEVDVAWIALHGHFGEDGQVQLELERMGVPYTGSGPRASSVAFDKQVARLLLAGLEIPVPRGFVVGTPLRPEKLWPALTSLGRPFVLKPTCEGSSIGVHIVEDKRQFERACSELNEMGGSVLCERFIAGRELTVAVLGSRALPPIETVTERPFFDYKAKYDKRSGTRYIVEPPLVAEVRAEATRLALATHRCLGCEGVSRVDMRLDPRGQLFVLEANTIPGMTESSLLPKAAAAVGIGLPEIAEVLLRLAFHKQACARRYEKTRRPRVKMARHAQRFRRSARGARGG